MNSLKKNTLIVGFGISGMSTARHLLATGVPFDVADQNIERATLSLQEMATGNLDISDIKVIEDDWTAELFSRYQCLVVSPGVSSRSESFQTARASGVEVIGDVELFARSAKKPVIAVTGSNGKSTVVSMTGEILRAAGLKAAVIGNVGLACLDGLNDNSVDVYVLELSSFQLETTSSLRPLVSTVLNVSEDHMDRYHGIDDYAAVKRSVYRNSMIAVVNADDSQSWSAENNHKRVTEFSTVSTDAPWSLHRLGDGTDELQGPDDISVDTAVMNVDGSHNHSNALASMALVSALLEVADSLPVGQLSAAELNSVFAAGLGQFVGLPHRTQLVRRANGVSWFNDSKGTNVGACVSAIEGLTGPVVLIAGGRGKGADFSPLGRAIEKKCRAVVLIGEDAERMSAAVSGYVPVYIEGSLTEAVERASSVARSGDSVLLSPACASFDMFANFEARGDAFADEVNRLCA